MRFPPELHPQLSARPILTVDDDAVDRAIFERVYREAGIAHPCRTFARGEDMIDALIEVLRGALPPLVCFLDVKMTGMNGFDVLRWIRCQRPLDDVPAVMLSSSEGPGDVREAGSFGAQCYLAKYPAADQLREVVREAERTAAAAGASAFHLPYNLLLSTHQMIN